MTARAKPAERRSNQTFEVEHGGQRFTVSVHRAGPRFKFKRKLEWSLTLDAGSDAGAPVEIFVSVSKQAGSALEAAVRDAAVLTSFALQYGTPFEEIRSAITRNDDGSPASAIGAILDAMAGA